jgi:aspartyl protease family protein
MKALLKIITIFLCFSSCANSNSYQVSKIVDGNTIELTNGVKVTLDNTEKSNENIRIIERYVQGKIFLFDNNNDEISKINDENISAIVYNSDGDCINDLLKKAIKISNEEKPQIKSTPDIQNEVRIRMTLDGGIYTIPVLINGVEMYFIFDTGASLISISSREALQLYNQGSLTESDFLGKGKFSDANGDISEGTIINLKTVQIGNRVLQNVIACVTHSQNAPLLFGQSALQKFGKVSIDYNNNEITFE